MIHHFCYDYQLHSLAMYKKLEKVPFSKVFQEFQHGKSRVSYQSVAYSAVQCRQGHSRQVHCTSLPSTLWDI